MSALDVLADFQARQKPLRRSVDRQLAKTRKHQHNEFRRARKALRAVYGK